MPFILVAEDDESIAKLIEKGLVAVGHEVTVVDNGHEALERAIEFQPDLIITDVMMPILDGWSLMRLLRARKETAFIPVIFLTQLTDTADRLQAFRLGADDYLTKPFHIEELQHRVKNIFAGSYLWDESRARISDASDINGKLERFALSSLLILLEQERKTGVLTLREGEEVCELSLRDGAPAHATLSNYPNLEPVECVHAALRWRTGSFEFHERDLDLPDRIQQSAMQILIEAARRLDERAAPRGEDD